VSSRAVLAFDRDEDVKRAFWLAVVRAP